MTREKAKELAKILKAYSEGKTIQRELCNNKWEDIKDLKGEDIKQSTIKLMSDYLNLRIKPEPKLVPFTLEDNKLFRDKWIKSKKNALPGVFRVISCNESNIHIEFGAIGYASLLDEFIFEDGSPCGKYITE